MRCPAPSISVAAIEPVRPSSTPAPDEWLSRVCRDTEMGRLVRDFDWTSTPLGSPATWPVGLRAAVAMAMSSQFPMLVVWGPELTKIYNDGYRPMLGSTKHPAALGAPVADVWPEIWDVIGPMFAHVIDTGEPTWVEHGSLVIERHGYAEECFFTYSYSALFDDDGSIAGVLDVVTETTREVVSIARLADVSRLNDALLGAHEVTAVCVGAVGALAGSTEVRGADVHLRVGEGLARIASNRRDDVAPVPDEVLRQVLESGEPLWWIGRGVVDARPDTFVAPFGVPHRGRVGAIVDGAAPLGGVVVLSLNRLRSLDDDHRRFLHLLVGSIGSAVDVAVQRAIEIGEHRHISETLQAAMLGPAIDLPTVAARYLPAVGNLAVGGDWYDVIDLDDHRRGVVVGDCVGHGLEAATAMAQLRSAARAMLLEGRDPASVLRGLDAFAASVPGAYCATVAVAVFDRQVGSLVYARAGHPPPLVVSVDGRATWLDDGAGPPLAVDPTKPRRNGHRDGHHLDDVLVMYSDGLVERRGESLDVELGRLATAAAELRGGTVHEIADALVARLLPEQATDDVVVVVKRLAAVGR